MISTIEASVMERINQIAPQSVLMHSDLRRGFPIKFKRGEKEEFITAHYNKLYQMFGDISMYMPAFNYKFFEERKTDVRNRVSEVGVLSEYFRKNIAEWYTKDPVFSFSCKGLNTYNDPVMADAIIDPFDDTSFFNYLYQQQSLLFHYGTAFKLSTVLHYIERKLGTIPYRYDKIFSGSITDGTEPVTVHYKYHARPSNRHLEYDTDKIERDLINEKILYRYTENNTQISFCSISEMTDYLFLRISRDPLYLLDEPSLCWIAPILGKLGRNFILEDFE